MRLVHALAVAFCVGCADQDETNAPVYGFRDEPRSWRVVVDATAPSGYFEATVEAAGRWEDALRDACPTSIAVDRATSVNSITYVTGNWTIGIDVGDPAGSCAGTTVRLQPGDPRQGARVTLEINAFDRFVGRVYWRVVAHELGHAFGLKHDVDGTIMYENWGTWDEPRISQLDVDAYARAWCAPRPPT